MSDDPRVQQLLDELIDSHSTPEAVCRSCPELLSTVRHRWQQLRRVQAGLDALFPPAGETATHAPELPPESVALPQVPGYEVESVLGRGGMGIVFQATHQRLHRRVALKMALAGEYAEPRERARFQREAEAVAALRHPNVVQVYDVGEVDGRPYFTMEYVEGGSLLQKLAGTPLPAREAAALLTTLAAAVQAAHASGIIHRDLKPANILLTADGTPKITDFGLARRLSGDSGLTQSGVALGTPSYMAPEQVDGKAHAVGPATDVYALGAILYELLTGRAPFKAESAVETLRQLVSQDPVPPSRLNAKVPRDLETICLHCLYKEPARRYASAAALADDLRRFQEGRPIQARPLGLGARLWRWGRRNPTAAALVTAVLALVGLAVGAGFVFQQQRAERRMDTARRDSRAQQALEARLEQATALEKQGRWPEARVALQVAPEVIDVTPVDLRERLRQALADADMVAELEGIRLRLSEGGRGEEPAPPSPEKLYEEAFRTYGIPLMTLDPEEVRARIDNSAIRETLLAFMHDWLYRLPDDKRARLREVLDRVDDDNWRHSFREALLEKDAKKLSLLTLAPGASAQPPAVISGLAAAMLGTMYKYEGQEYMRKAQQRYPRDFWLNYLLGCFWCEELPQEAVGYLQVAVAIRPTSDGAYMMLGRALRGVGDTEGAIAAFRRSLELNASSVVAKELAWALAPKGELEEVRAAWEKFLERDPPEHDAWYGYAQLCLFVGNEEAYRRARTALLTRFGDTRNDWTIAERTSLACLLLPDSGDELQAAVRLADLAVAEGDRPTKTDNPYLRFVKGLAIYRQGRPKEAIPLLQEAAEKLPSRAGPGLTLAMARFRSGSTTEARKTLADAVRANDWYDLRAASQIDQPTIWVSHVLRREAEALILPNLPAFLQGNYQPQDNDERIALLGICQSRGLYGAATRLYADAFKADPGLADRMSEQCLRHAIQGTEAPPDRTQAFNAACRYLAARCSALAGCGLGKDGDKIGGADRSRWRKQAREWLRADLAMWAAKLNSDSPSERSLARRMLLNWQTDPDLSGVREPSALDDLPADERNDCLALWREVRAQLKGAGQDRATAVLDPKRTESRPPSPQILMRLGRLKEARVAWKSAIEAEPLDHGVWHGYAELCLFLGEAEEYHRARRDLLERFGATTDPYVAERISRACLLMPVTGDELQKAVAVAERAVAGNPGEQGARAYFEFARGLAEYRKGKSDLAIAMMRGDASTVLGPAPALVTAMALHQKGQADEARKTLASAVLSYDWSANQVRDVHGCILHTLRREAESMILPNLPAFMDGKYQPQDNDERLALLGICQFTNRSRAMAGLYADAFAADPALADDLAAGQRYSAVRAAARAGCGDGADASGLKPEERGRWREQARRWLRAELAARARALDTGAAETRGIHRMALTRWRSDPDLAGLRDPAELEKLPANERKEFITLWADLDAQLARTQK
jgi:serine/threonine-protein kinase